MPKDKLKEKIIKILEESLSDTFYQRKRIADQILEETKEEIMGEIKKNGYIVGRREGNAFKECSWEEIIKKM